MQPGWGSHCPAGHHPHAQPHPWVLTPCCPGITPRSAGSPKGLWGQAGRQQLCPWDTLTPSSSPDPRHGQPGWGVQAPLRHSLKIQTWKPSASGLNPQGGASQITFFNQNRCVWPQNVLWPPKPSSSSLGQNPVPDPPCPGNRGPGGPFRASLPRQQLCGTRSRAGGVPGPARGSSGGFGGAWGASGRA